MEGRILEPMVAYRQREPRHHRISGLSGLLESGTDLTLVATGAWRIRTQSTTLLLICVLPSPEKTRFVTSWMTRHLGAGSTAITGCEAHS